MAPRQHELFGVSAQDEQQGGHQPLAEEETREAQTNNKEKKKHKEPEE